MRKGWFRPVVALLTLVAVTIGVIGYLKYVYDQRRSADEAILKKVNLEAGILSRDGYVYHVIFNPPYNKNFRDADLKHLAEIKHLEIIWVQDIPFTDRSLEELAKLKKLRSIVLGNTNVTDKGVDRLRKALPQTQILVARPKSAQSG